MLDTLQHHLIWGAVSPAYSSLVAATDTGRAHSQTVPASDVDSVSGAIPAGGTATVVFSRDRNAGVLVMNDVQPPAPGTVYQMWLVSPAGASLAGTMDAEAVAPSTTAVLENLGQSTKLAFTVEPASGSTKPTGQLIAELPLS